MMRLLKKLRLIGGETRAIPGGITKAIDRRLSDLTASGASVKCNLGCGKRHHPEWINIDFHGDGTFGGDTMFHTFALFEYSLQWFGSRGYHITSAGVSTDHEFSLELRPA